MTIFKAPQKRKVYSKQEFLVFFTLEERAKWALAQEKVKEDFRAWNAQNTDPTAETPVPIAAVMSTAFMVDNTENFIMNNQEVLGGLGVMQAIGIITPERLAEIAAK